MFLAALYLTFQQIQTPIDFGKRALTRSLGATASKVEVSIKPGGPAESFAITNIAGKTHVTGADANGAMYGALELAERYQMMGAKALTTPKTGKPFLHDRGNNLFLTLPWNYAKNDTDYDPAALTDPNRWWFHNEDYWTTLLDLMAQSRLNWLDIHGAWDISSTGAPNMYAYFVTSPTFPKVGVSDDIKSKNLKQLNHVIEMAHARGIRVSLMCYEANLRIPQNNNPGYQASEANIYKYTTEVVEKMIRGVPKLDAIGFRIGESGHGEAFFNCYGEAVKNSGRDIPLVTRSWITRKQKVLPLARASKDFTVEIKYNGEQWGAPYIVMGGRMANWSSYSYEDYLSDSGPGGAKMWPGNQTSEGKQWPAEPYKIVWQVRANGTHRIFPFYNPEWTRRSIKAMPLGTTSGYTIEGEDAYFPKSPDYYLKDPKDKYCNWIHQRDEMYWMCWGRLGYDPETPEAVFDHRAAELAPGKIDSQSAVQLWKKASVAIPKAYMAYSLGPDHRNHAPELEWGGDTGAFIHGQGFDTFINKPIDEKLANDATKGQDFRNFPAGNEAIINLPQADRNAMYKAPGQRGAYSGRLKEIWESAQLQKYLDYYYAARLSSADSAAFQDANEDKPGYWSAAGQASSNSFEMATYAYKVLAQNPYYKSFTDRLRMHTNTFSWASEFKKVEAENAKLKEATKSLKLMEMDAERPPVPAPVKPVKVQWAAKGSNIEYSAKSEGADNAWLLIKPLPSSTFFHRIAMKKQSQGSFTLELPRRREGVAFAVELTRGGATKRVPDVGKEAPYIVVPSLHGPTPQIYNAEEAIRFLNPDKINTAKYGGILVGSRASQFWLSNDRATKRKLLNLVDRGLNLVILQQDFGKYKLDWMPKPINIEPGQSDKFEQGTLHFRNVTAPGIMWQKFAPSEGWQIHGNGGLASFKHGKGTIWVTTARLMQNMHRPEAAKAFVALLSLGGTSKPTILVDGCSEGGEFTSSLHPDLMNSHNIPFVTLGEAIAQDQGMDEYTVVPGVTANDDVLGGKGEQIANAFLKKQVQKAAAKPIPATKEELEADRARKKSILMKSLGLDPLPAKTPLNARITGTIQQKGYHIEKLVYESRPNWYVTAHVYVPDLPQFKTKRLPMIVNVNGHWAHKKSEDRLQLRSAFQALQGYITLTVDTPGWSFEGNNLIERRAEGTHNDFKLLEGGSNTTGYYAWDVMRGLDYMATRSDVDMDHVGITGASGGGLATLFIFASDDRYKAAVPVVYMSSMELAPDNGCLCNHVPATNQIGDKSDVLSIQAPKPVYIMGAQNDGEFPPNGMLLTHKKAEQIWSLYGKGKDTFVQIYAGGHDYNQPMREDMIGFFNKYLKGQGDGSRVKEPPIEVIDPEDHKVLVLDPPIVGERTMRDLSNEYIANAPTSATVAEAIAVNGGVPVATDLNYKEQGTGDKRVVTFESEPGLVTPGLLYLPKGEVLGVKIVANDGGKAEVAKPHADGYAYLYIDVLGTGELGTLEMRYPVYLGKSVAFVGGWQIARAADAMRKYSTTIEIEGNGPIASQSIMWAAFMDDSFAKVTGTGCLGEWKDVFADSISDYAVQPRAHLMGTLAGLRSKVKNSSWSR